MIVIMHRNFGTIEGKQIYVWCQNNQDRNVNIVYLYNSSKVLICINSRWPPYDLQIITLCFIHIETSGDGNMYHV